MEDRWKSGNAYEQFMGRWSYLVARDFIEWLSLPSGLTWLEVGCGSGALSEVVMKHCQPAGIIAVDQSADFVHTTAQRLGSQARCIVGDALALPLEDAAVNVTVSGLVLNFLSAPEKALAEMRRVTAAGGTVALYLWDYAGKMELLRYFWDAAVELNPKAIVLHESRRFPACNAEALHTLLEKTGFTEIVTTPIEIVTHFRDFDDYWQPFLGGQGPAPTYVLSLREPERKKLRDVLYERLPRQEDGSFSLVASAWGAKGRVQPS